jgi:hypothetical protein
VLKEEAVPSKNLGGVSVLKPPAISSPPHKPEQRRQSKRIEKKKALANVALEDNKTPTAEIHNDDETQITISSESESDNDDETDGEERTRSTTAESSESEDEKPISVICLDEETNDEPAAKPSDRGDSSPIVIEQKTPSQPTELLQDVGNHKKVIEETNVDNAKEEIFTDDPELVHEIIQTTPDTNKIEESKINTKKLAAKLLRTSRMGGQPSTVQQLQSLHDQLKTYKWQNCSSCLTQMSDLIGHLKASHSLQSATTSSIKYKFLNTGVQQPNEESQLSTTTLLPVTTALKRKSPTPIERPTNKVQLIEQRIDSLMKQTNEKGLKRFDISMKMIPNECREGSKSEDSKLIKINTSFGGNNLSTEKTSTDG